MSSAQTTRLRKQKQAGRTESKPFDDNHRAQPKQPAVRNTKQRTGGPKAVWVLNSRGDNLAEDERGGDKAEKARARNVPTIVPHIREHADKDASHAISDGRKGYVGCLELGRRLNAFVRAECVGMRMRVQRLGN